MSDKCSTTGLEHKAPSTLRKALVKLLRRLGITEPSVKKKFNVNTFGVVNLLTLRCDIVIYIRVGMLPSMLSWGLSWTHLSEYTGLMS